LLGSRHLFSVLEKDNNYSFPDQGVVRNVSRFSIYETIRYIKFCLTLFQSHF